MTPTRARSGAAGHASWLAIRLVVALFILAILGCSGSSSRTPQSVSPSAVSSPVGTVEPLPPQLAAILDRVAGLRGLPAPVGLKAGFVARSDLPALLDHLTTADDLRVFHNLTTLDRLLGHLRPDQDYASVYREFTPQAVIGLYSAEDKTLWIVEPDGGSVNLDSLSQETTDTLAHELTHALQDAKFDLLATGKKLEDNLDQNLAWTCVVEGDAVTTQRAYSAQYGLAPLSGRVFLVVDRSALADVPASISRELYFPYREGTDWLAAVRQRGGNDAVDRLLQAPPAGGTAAVLQPSLFDAGWAPPAVSLPDVTRALGAGWSRESGGTFGEFELRNYLQLRLPASEAVRGSGGWGGDHYDVYVHGGQSVALFRLRFQSAGQAQQFRDAQSMFLATMTDGASTSGGVTVTTTKDGNATARVAGGRPDEVLFAIGSSADVASRAARAVAGG